MLTITTIITNYWCSRFPGFWLAPTAARPCLSAGRYLRARVELVRRRKRRRARVFCGTPAPGPRARTFLGFGMTQLSATWVPDLPLGAVICCSTSERWSHNHHVAAKVGSSTLRGILHLHGEPIQCSMGLPSPVAPTGF